MEKPLNKVDKYKLLTPFLNGLMDPYESDKAYIETVVDLFIVNRFARKHILLHPGELANHIHLMISGLARTFYSRNGKNITSMFFAEGEMATLPVSYYKRKPGNEGIELLEESVVASLRHDDYECISHASATINRLREKMKEQFLVLAEGRNQLLRIAKPHDKFAFFMQTQGELIGRIPDDYIATYLGMGRSTMNKIKAHFFANKGK
jgi:CRP-like cAMP-binding protein